MSVASRFRVEGVGICALCFMCHLLSLQWVKWYAIMMSELHLP